MSVSAVRNQAVLPRVLLNPRAMAPADDTWCTICKDHIEIIDQDLYKEEVR